MHCLVQKSDEFQSYIFNFRPKKVVVYFFLYDILLYLHEHSCTHYLETAVYGFNRVYMQHIGDSST